MNDVCPSYFVPDHTENLYIVSRMGVLKVLIKMNIVHSN